jgi:hypothetical protein
MHCKPEKSTGWRLNGSTAGLDGGLGSPLSTQAAGVAYAAGRYGDGLLVKDTTRVAWSVSIPSVFHTSFWFIPAEVTTCVIWVATGPAGLLLVGYDAATSVFFLEDQLSRQVTVPFAVSMTDGAFALASARPPRSGRLSLAAWAQMWSQPVQPLRLSALSASLRLY